MAQPKFVMVVTYGRSGSTLLMSMLNTIRGSRITGENNNALYFTYKAIEAARSSKEKFGKAEMGTDFAWYGAHSIDAEGFRRELLESFKRNVLGVKGREPLIGFKEIRYSENRMHVDDLNGYLEFVLQQIPNSLIIINTRDIAATAKSSWFKGRPDAEDYLRRTEARLLAFASSHRENVVHLHFDDYIKNPDSMIAVLAKSGIHLDKPKIEAVLAKPHSTSAVLQQRDVLKSRPTWVEWVMKALFFR